MSEFQSFSHQGSQRAGSLGVVEFQSIGILTILSKARSSLD
jgi:hypothetical protein